MDRFLGGVPALRCRRPLAVEQRPCSAGARPGSDRGAVHGPAVHTPFYRPRWSSRFPGLHGWNRATAVLLEGLPCSAEVGEAASRPGSDFSSRGTEVPDPAFHDPRIDLGTAFSRRRLGCGAARVPGTGDGGRHGRIGPWGTKAWRLANLLGRHIRPARQGRAHGTKFPRGEMQATPQENPEGICSFAEFSEPPHHVATRHDTPPCPPPW